MNYKPDEGTLMAYLYGELDAATKEQVDLYLAEHPQARERLQHLAVVRKSLAALADVEVIAPPVFVAEEKRAFFWSSRYLKIPMGIAASLLLLLLAGRFFGPEVKYAKGELLISFRATQQEEVQAQLLSAQEVQQMINNSLAQNNQAMVANWKESNLKLQESLHQNLQQSSARIDKLIGVASQASQDQVRTFVAGLQEENLKLMQDYFKLSAKDQQVYVENLLVDFTKYLQEQRKQDLVLFQARMNNIEKNTDQFKQETELILASIISNPEGAIKKVNNY
ncbi:MAG: hypothetical protein KF775_09685 [Cyclobacteriaceae bacterium]|nr:hypothetical protein [Cytophagales bacterium]MBX2899913.1 hypothetical protein [Cyclobacteriaceae bacterium]